MDAVAASQFRARLGSAAAETFYHLDHRDVTQLRCNGMACFVARHRDAVNWEEAERQKPRVHCLGHCYAGPADGSCAQRPLIECPAPEPILLARILKGGAKTLESYRSAGGYQALAAALRRPSEEVIEQVEAAHLRGRGGAAFPIADKWWSAVCVDDGEKYVIANADEGDPGAYIDRLLMEDDPFAVIEGLTLAGYAIGARHGWIYIRAEYPKAAVSIRNALKEAEENGFLGEKVLGTDFEFKIEVVSGQGSYICGEETALVGSIEGLRPEAQIRPPYCSERGLFNRPSVVNNIETLANVPWIVLNSGSAFATFGFSKSRGTKLVSLNSLFRRPGLYEVEFGIQVRDIVEEIGGGLRDGNLKGLIIGGPLAGVIPPHLLGTPFGFEELREIGAEVGHGGVIAFDERTSIAELVHHVFSFGAYESCGKCTPCRLGSARIAEIFERIIKGEKGTADEENDWLEVHRAMKAASLCGHGTGLAAFADSLFRHYRKELSECFA